MGFAFGGDSVNKSSCDNKQPANADLRLCWHLGSDVIASGYRCGDDEEDPGALFGDNWERLIFVSDAVVPTVSAWQLIVLAILIVTLALVSLRRVRSH